MAPGSNNFRIHAMLVELAEVEKVKGDSDVLCVATLSHFDYLPFCLIGVNQQLESFLITGWLIRSVQGFKIFKFACQ